MADLIGVPEARLNDSSAVSRLSLTIVFTETDNTEPPFPSTQHYTLSPSSVRVLTTDSPGLYTQSQSTENQKNV